MTECTKRPFVSEKQARLAHKRAGFRIRVYVCDRCGSLHVTNNEKRRGGKWEEESEEAYAHER